MTCRHCVDAAKFFGTRTSRRDARRYRRKGPARETEWLLHAIRRRLPDSFSLLDIGGGVGAIQHELAAAGAERVHAVDASDAYLAEAREEAVRRGYVERARYLHGDFVEVAEEVPPATVVTLDRVLCCYPDMPGLVRRSAERAERLYGLVVPRVRWWVRLGVGAANLWLRLRRSDFRVFLHQTAAVAAELEELGFTLVERERSLVWDVRLFERRPSARPAAG